MSPKGIAQTRWIKKEEELAMKYSLPELDMRKTGSVAKIERLGSIFLRYGLVGRNWLDRSDEGHRIRGKRHSTSHCT